MSDNLLTGLNENQAEAAGYEGDKLLILAGAGSGKTRVLTHRAAWFIKHKNIPTDNILLLTFTNKAAHEMKERIFDLVGVVPAYSGTFHSFCVKVLKRDADKIDSSRDFVIYDSQDQKQAIKDILEELNLDSSSYKPSGISAIISDAKSQMISPAKYRDLAQGDNQEKFSQIYMLYEKYLKKAGALDFDDLLLKTVELFKTKPEVLQKWKNRISHILVDEWQDTNKIQYTLTKLLVGDSGNLTAVGDASQSIYSWRGADYKNITYLKEDYPDIKVINLEQNYRSSKNILDAANSIISKNSSHPVLELWTDNEGGERIKLYKAQNGLEEAKYVTRQISSLQKIGVRPQDIAILYRTNAQSRVLEESLLHAGIPYKIIGGTRFYDRTEIKDVLAYLRLLVNPNDTVSEKRALKNGGKRRFSKFLEFRDSLPSSVPSLVIPDSDPGSIQINLDSRLRGNDEKSGEKVYTTLELLDNVLNKTGYLDKFSRQTEENLQRLDNIKELRSVAQEFPDVREFLENVALVEAEQNSTGQLNYDQDEGQITLMTLHAAKGLEFPAVFLVGLEEGVFPHSRSMWDQTQLEEERRLAYVGVTRAKEFLYITLAERRVFYGQSSSNPPSRFLVDIPEHLLDNSDNFTTDSPVKEWYFD